MNIALTLDIRIPTRLLRISKPLKKYLLSKYLLIQFFLMRNSEEHSNINKENIYILLKKIEDMNKFQSKIQHEIHEILDLCNLIDSINCDLNEFEYLFTLINKEEIFKRHFQKSMVVLDTFTKWGQLSEIANMDLQDSSEKIFTALKESLEFIELKFQLEKNINNQ